MNPCMSSLRKYTRRLKCGVFWIRTKTTKKRIPTCSHLPEAPGRGSRRWGDYRGSPITPGKTLAKRCVRVAAPRIHLHGAILGAAADLAAAEVVKARAHPSIFA